jgi:hypothetical protein
MRNDAIVLGGCPGSGERPGDRSVRSPSTCPAAAPAFLKPPTAWCGPNTKPPSHASLASLWGSGDNGLAAVSASAIPSQPQVCVIQIVASRPSSTEAAIPPNRLYLLAKKTFLHHHRRLPSQCEFPLSAGTGTLSRPWSASQSACWEFSSHIARAKYKKGNSKESRRSLLGLVAATVLLGPVARC